MINSQRRQHIYSKIVGYSLFSIAANIIVIRGLNIAIFGATLQLIDVSTWIDGT